ncbi:MAG: acyltransferase [Candidatus Pacebacteria bacterium]|nr:acyltransferase [Candidatus Paceibacterota bacterium]
MTIEISNMAQSTQIFLVIFVIALLFTFKKKTTSGLSLHLTQELKGLSILAVVFSHLGYSLVNNHNFLFPLSILGGVGVNIFLFLSGYGMVTSSLSKEISIPTFYKNQLLKLYKPFWLTLIFLFILDFLILNKVYSLGYIGQSLLGFFPRADLFLDVNSPLWYFTFIVFYYLLFPLIFYRKRPWVSGILIGLISYFMILLNPSILKQVMYLYKLHFVAFPLGVFIGGLVFKYKDILFEIIKKQNWQNIKHFKTIKRVSYHSFIIFLLCLISYTAYYSHVGDAPWLEQTTSMITSLAIILLFLISKFEKRLFYLFGIFSYEIYLIHWPILSRFDIFYRFIPAWLATILYLVFFIFIGWIIKKILKKIKLI